jgi:hypothetical protein
VIATTYFAAVAHLPEIALGQLKPVSIARRSVPGWAEMGYGEISSLRPWEHTHERYRASLITQTEYEREYRELVLKGFDAKHLAEQLDGCCLVCWEKPPKFCHRHIVAWWLKTEAGVVVRELGLQRQERHCLKCGTTDDVGQEGYCPPCWSDVLDGNAQET